MNRKSTGANMNKLTATSLAIATAPPAASKEPEYDWFEVARRLGVPVWVYDIDRFSIPFANKAACDLWQAETEQELSARDMGRDMSVTVAKRLRQYQSDFVANASIFNEMWTLYPNGAPVNVMVYFRGFRLPDGRMAMLCEVTGEADNLPQNLRSAEALLHTDVMITLYGEDGRPLYMNPAARNHADSPEHRLSDLFSEAADYQQMEVVLQAAGEHRMVTRVNTFVGARWFDLSAKLCQDAATGEGATLVTAIDVSELKTARDKARYLADRDQLTGCYNRSYLQLSIAELSQNWDRQPCAILYFDVDRFKQINDMYGHDAGDSVLVRLAERALSVVRRDDTVARMGGDEFVVVLRSVPDIEVLLPEVERIRAALSQPVEHDFTKIDVTVSMGITTFLPREISFTDILQQADQALYAAKSAGRNCARVFDDQMGAEARSRQQTEIELKSAITHEEFVLHYQPRLDLETGRVVSAEALVRWQHRSHGLLMPDSFISICEETGMIDDLGQIVLKHGYAKAQELVGGGHEIDVSINISPRQFKNDGLMERLSEIAAEEQFPTDRIELEITENVLIGDPDLIAEKLRAITRMGYRIAIDDFGTGYSNLSYISRFPLHCIKIDKSFIDNIEDSAPIVELILTLAQQIGAVTVAEGVETEQQLNWLKAHGCAQAQGYLLSRAVPEHELLDVIGSINQTYFTQ